MKLDVNKLPEFWRDITRDRDIAYKDRVWMEGYDAALVYCAEQLEAALAQQARAVSVPRDSLLTEARRLRYRAGESYGLCAAQTTDAGAQMIHTAEALESLASSALGGGACGGCGNTDSAKRCVGCLHPFGALSPKEQV